MAEELIFRELGLWEFRPREEGQGGLKGRDSTRQKEHGQLDVVIWGSWGQKLIV